MSRPTWMRFWRADPLSIRKTLGQPPVIQVVAGGFVILRVALKREVAGATPLLAEEDRLLREAFGRYGGTERARIEAAAIVRRLQTTDRGHWVHCDCRPGLPAPPILVPVEERHLRRLVTDVWPEHEPACEFYKEPVDQAAISASYQPQRRPLRLVRTFLEARDDILPRLERHSRAQERPQLAALLVRLMTQAGLQRIEAGGFKPQPIPEQMRPLWPLAREIPLDKQVRLADVLCMSVSKLPALAARIEAASDADFPHTRPHGVLIIRVASVGVGKMRSLNGEDIPVSGRMAVFGDRPQDEPGGANEARAPYLAICIVARPEPGARAQVTTAYVHPCASGDRLMLIDSDAERQTMKLLVNFQYAMLKKHGAVVTIEKPMDSLVADRAPDGRWLPPIIPDFIVTVQDRSGAERRAVIETMGYADEGYRERKARLHPEMQRAAAAQTIISHDLVLPAHWQQEWRDNQFRRELWRQLAPKGQSE